MLADVYRTLGCVTTFISGWSMSRLYWNFEEKKAESILSVLAAIWNPRKATSDDPQIQLLLRSMVAIADLGAKKRIKNWSVLNEAYHEQMASGGHGLEDFEKRVRDTVNRHDKRRHQNQLDYRVVLAVENGLSGRIKFPFSVKIHSCILNFRQFTSVDECIGRSLKKLGPHVGADMSGEGPPAYARCRVKAGCHEIAMEKAMSAYSLWRATVNFSSSLSHRSNYLSPQPRADLPRPRWVVSVSGNTAGSLRASAGTRLRSGPWRLAIVGNAQLMTASKLLHGMKTPSPDGSITTLIADCLRLFGLAVDQESWDLSLLVFWQMAERLSLIDRNDPHEKISKRLARLQPVESVLQGRVADALNDIMEKRHRIAHGGKFGITEDSDVSFVEECCKNALLWINAAKHLLKTESDLRAYYHYCNQDDNQLKRGIRIAKMLLPTKR